MLLVDPDGIRAAGESWLRLQRRRALGFRTMRLEMTVSVWSRGLLMTRSVWDPFLHSLTAGIRCEQHWWVVCSAPQEAMAAAEYYSGACMEYVPKHLLAPQPLQRAQTEQIGRRRDDHGIAQGRIMWLPAVDHLPERAVRRAHGKGAVEDGIYNHPVVIVSRPADDEQTVHFHLVSWTPS